MKRIIISLSIFIILISSISVYAKDEIKLDFKDLTLVIDNLDTSLVDVEYTKIANEQIYNIVDKESNIILETYKMIDNNLEDNKTKIERIININDNTKIKLIFDISYDLSGNFESIDNANIAICDSFKLLDNVSFTTSLNNGNELNYWYSGNIINNSELAVEFKLFNAKVKLNKEFSFYEPFSGVGTLKIHS